MDSRYKGVNTRTIFMAHHNFEDLLNHRNFTGTVSYEYP